ncbi:MAG: NAD-dependent epimerase/dehydratase family protein [Candidatus Hodarchaeales archaeon]|jgi:nucleoside-diphosphate-sugar epimerase
MTILITGATGLVGEKLVSNLLKSTLTNLDGQKIRLLIRKRIGSESRENFIKWVRENDIEIYWGDLGKTSDILGFMSVPDPKNSILIHLAAIFNFYEPYNTLYETNVMGTYRILREFQTKRIKKMIFLSSVAVYGKLQNKPELGVTEDFPLDIQQRKSYELTKSLSEKAVVDFQRNNLDRSIIIIRPTGIIGGKGVTTDIFARMFFKQYVLIPGKGSERLSLVDVNDVVRAIIFFCNNDMGSGEAYNLVSFTPTLKEFLSEFSKVLEKQNINFISIPIQLFKPIYYFSRIVRYFKKANPNSLFLPILFDKLGQDVWIESTKIQKLGFVPKSTLKQSLISTKNFLKKNPWYKKEKFRVSI